MMDENTRVLKNKQISNTKRETIERHKQMSIKTFDVKIQENALSSKQKEALKMIFLEQKWYKNFILSWSEQSIDNRITKFDTKQSDILKKDKDMNDIPVHIKYLSAQSRQCLVSRMYANMKTLHTLKSKGLQKPGKLKFSKEERIIDLKQYGVSHKIISSKRIKIAGIPSTVVVNGLKQFIDFSDIEYANARLINRPTGYYIQFVCYIPKEDKRNNGRTLGIDFGCSTSFTTSEGEKIDIKIQESERLKRLQKNLAKKKKGSKSFDRNVGLIRKEYQNISNRKKDFANKVCAHFNDYANIVIQDEQLHSWQKSNHGKAIQHSILGIVKQKLENNPKTTVLNRWVFTSKLCNQCGLIHDDLELWDREFVCDCGYHEDRDVNAAKNMVWFYNNNVGVGRTKVKRVEMEALVYSKFSRLDSNSKSMKHEGSSF